MIDVIVFLLNKLLGDAKNVCSKSNQISLVVHLTRRDWKKPRGLISD